MDENITDAIQFASTDNIADMQTSIQSALQSKIVDALEAKRIEVAQSFMQKANESEEPVDDFEEEDLNEYEIVKRYNPKTGKHEYVDDEGNVMHGSGGASWQKSWYSRKRPSDYSSSTPSSTSQKIYHNVPFKQKDQAKAEGMRFDGEKKKWYHTNGEKSKKSVFPKLQESYLEEKLDETVGVTDYNPPSQGGTRKELLAKYSKSKNPKHAEAARKAGATQTELKNALKNEELKGNQFKLDKNKNGKLDANDFKLLKKESHLEEKLSVSDGVSAWIKDFVHSDDSRFEGKSKEERRQMALGAFYDAKKQQNEEVEQIDELSRSGIISRYINKTNPDYSSPKEIEKRKEGRSLALKKKWGDKKFGFPEPKVKAKD